MTNPELDIETGSEGKWTKLSVAGEIDVLTSPQLQSALDEAMVSSTNIVLDLTSVTFMDSTGLGVLVRSLKKVQDGDGDLRLVVQRSNILRVLEITGLDQVFAVFPTLVEAAA